MGFSSFQLPSKSMVHHQGRFPFLNDHLTFIYTWMSSNEPNLGSYPIYPSLYLCIPETKIPAELTNSKRTNKETNSQSPPLSLSLWSPPATGYPAAAARAPHTLGRFRPIHRAYRAGCLRVQAAAHLWSVLAGLQLRCTRSKPKVPLPPVSLNLDSSRTPSISI